MVLPAVSARAVFAMPWVTGYLNAKASAFRLPRICRRCASACVRAASMAAEAGYHRAHCEAARPEGDVVARVLQQRGATRSGAHHLGHGSLRHVQTLARQADAKTFIRPTAASACTTTSTSRPLWPSSRTSAGAFLHPRSDAMLVLVQGE